MFQVVKNGFVICGFEVETFFFNDNKMNTLWLLFVIIILTVAIVLTIVFRCNFCGPNLWQDLIDNFYIENDDIRRSTFEDWEAFPELQYHPKRVLDKNKALLIILKAFSIDELKLLPVHDTTKHYLVFIRVSMDENLDILELPLFKMKNVLFCSFDLRDHLLVDDNIKPLRGVTIPSPYKFDWKVDTKIKRKYLFSFKGNCNQNGWFGSANVRKKLKELTFDTTNSNFLYLFEDTSDPAVKKDKHLYKKILIDSTYGLVLHGDGRWSHRLIETFGSGAIPVIISDGLTLPFSQLIDYKDACIIIEERIIYEANHIDVLINLLPKDQETQQKLQRNALYIYHSFFKSNKVICDLLLVCTKLERLK